MERNVNEAKEAGRQVREEAEGTAPRPLKVHERPGCDVELRGPKGVIRTTTKGSPGPPADLPDDLPANSNAALIAAAPPPARAWIRLVQCPHARKPPRQALDKVLRHLADRIERFASQRHDKTRVEFCAILATPVAVAPQMHVDMNE